jgi:hypothetical protein
MPRATQCRFKGRQVGITEALQLRETKGRGLPFRCIQCEKPVKPHRAGGHTASHFEHLRRNKSCDLSDT